MKVAQIYIDSLEAFDGWNDAHAFWKHITDHRLCSRAQVRESERFTTHDWEVKVWSISPTTLEKLIDRDRKRSRLPLPTVRRDWPIAECVQCHRRALQLHKHRCPSYPTGANWLTTQTMHTPGNTNAAHTTKIQH